MSKENKLIPALRFPEFVKDGKWEEKTLIDVADKKVKWSFTGGPFGSNLKASDYTPNGIRIIQLQNIGDGEFYDEYKIFTSPEKADELLSCNIYSGEIILSKMGDPVGRACFIPDFLERCVMASDGIRLVVDEKKYSKYFVFSLINSKPIRESIEKKATGSTRKRIGLEELKGIQLIIPRLKEQQKVAFCLASLDEVIAAHSQKLELLKEHKKVLMQNLFPQKGEKVPKFRFPEFVIDGEWEKKKLGEIGKITSGGTPNRSNSEFWNGDIPWISTTLINFNTINEANEYITDSGLQNSSAKIFPKNTILMAMYGQGKTRGKVAILGINATTNQACAAIILKEGYNTNFSFQYLASKYDEIRKMSNSGGQENLSGGLIEIIPISIPKNPKEQQKIASCLSSLDELITKLSDKTEQLKLHKKGLMQGLFPKMTEQI